MSLRSEKLAVSTEVADTSIAILKISRSGEEKLRPRQAARFVSGQRVRKINRL